MSKRLIFVSLVFLFLTTSCNPHSKPMTKFGPNIRYRLLGFGCREVSKNIRQPNGDRMTVLQLTFVTDAQQNGGWMFEPKILLVERKIINPIPLDSHGDQSIIYVEWPDKRLPNTRADGLAENKPVNLYAHPDWIRNTYEKACR